ncbi:MAG: hypothetical protein H7173_02385 [Rhodoferax sp.]|nr:hypothetical protein [Pseudorhodobacter sp.]
MEQLIISLIAGVLGGNGAAAIMKNLSLGTLGNSIVGLLGGGLGTYLLQMMGAPVDPAASMDIGSIISSIASGGVGGGVLLAIVGALKGVMAK